MFALADAATTKSADLIRAVGANVLGAWTIDDVGEGELGSYLSRIDSQNERPVNFSAEACTSGSSKGESVETVDEIFQGT